MNFYAYCNGDPLGKVDPWGLWNASPDFGGYVGSNNNGNNTSGGLESKFNALINKLDMKMNNLRTINSGNYNITDDFYKNALDGALSRVLSNGKTVKESIPAILKHYDYFKQNYSEFSDWHTGGYHDLFLGFIGEYGADGYNPVNLADCLISCSGGDPLFHSRLITNGGESPFFEVMLHEPVHDSIIGHEGYWDEVIHEFLDGLLFIDSVYRNGTDTSIK